MTDVSPESSLPAPPPPPAAVTELLAAEPAAPAFQPEQITWVVELIADRDFHPGQPGTPWAGEDVTIAATINQYACPRDVAKAMVDAAVAELWTERADNPARVERRMMIKRYEGYRRWLWKEIKNPRGTTHYDVKPKMGPDNVQEVGPTGRKRWTRTPVKMTVARKLDPSMFLLLFRVEQELRSLLNIDGDVARQNLKDELLKMLTEGGNKIPAATQAALTQFNIENLNVQQLPPRAQVIARELKAPAAAPASEPGDDADAANPRRRRRGRPPAAE